MKPLGPRSMTSPVSAADRGKALLPPFLTSLILGLVSILFNLSIFHRAVAETQAPIETVQPCFVAPFPEMREPIGPFECGYVVVPENHVAPSDRTIRLGFVRLPARRPADAAPIFMLSGGPGNSLLQPVTFSLFSDEMLGPLREDRDIVILEQRGSMHSVPRLDCPLVHRLPWMVNQLGLDREAGRSLSHSVLADCVAQARSHGIDLSQYNSLAIAADIDLARQSLGYDQIIYYGASYGSQLGQHMMRDYPETLAAVVLDGASALSVRSWMQDRVINVDEGLEHLVATCEADGKCAEAYDIRALLDQAMALFADGPIPASFTDPSNPETTVSLSLNEEDFAMAVYEMQTGQIFIRSLPAMLHMAVADGRQSMATVLGEVVGPKIVAARNAQGGIVTLMHAAVVCSDDPVTSDKDMVIPEGASAFARVFGEAVLDEYLMYCESVDVPPLPDATDVDPVVDVPTLILSGWLDVRTPTARSLEVAKALPKATLVTFWEGTHVQLAEVNTCAAQIVRVFVADPEAEVDASCVGETPKRGFVLPDFSISVDPD
ncbi:alpha/beta hydrolase [Albidovulum sediminis]|uniref:Proline iminopeptidase n=1 Tax=Albidovulum sediminis TaxID=3066345 RepID=A0ABT2NKV2_9RHOB|nr:alpha/beta hydrolase [Defluviimonas sediminis]MCT8329370.1 alpha/beta hydrolase [Defluviimonas sediminis]